MRRAITLAALAGSVCVAGIAAQAVPDSSQAARVDAAYRRTQNLRIDPFRHAFLPGWGLVISTGVWAENSALNLKDVRAFQYIDDNDKLLVTDLIDALGLIPRGSGLGVTTVSENGLYLGGPIGGHLGLGVTAQARVYGGGSIDDDALAFIRDGNGSRQDFSLGDSRGEGIVTGEVGLHSLIRLGPLASVDGAVVTLGLGGRYLWSQGYVRVRSLVADGGSIRIAPDGVSASFDIETLVTQDIDEQLPNFDRGTGLAGDLMVRVEWPTSGLAFEGMLANVGKIKVLDVERRTARLDVVTSNLIEFADSLDALDWVTDTVDVEVNLPRLVRFSASGWANRILQLDVSTTFGLNTGEYDLPLAVDLGTTWRFVRAFPLRVGVVAGGHGGLGYTGGVAIETGNFILQVAGGSLGGLFGNATGAAGRLDLGFYF